MAQRKAAAGTCPREVLERICWLKAVTERSLSVLFSVKKPRNLVFIKRDDTVAGIFAPYSRSRYEAKPARTPGCKEAACAHG